MIPRKSISIMSEVSRARALIAVIRRDLPELLAPGIDERAAALAGVGEVVAALLAILPPGVRTAIEREAAALDAAARRARLETEIRAGSKTAPLMLLGLADTEGDA
jgi:predicted component of type VI protein secretion system